MAISIYMLSLYVESLLLICYAVVLLMVNAAHALVVHAVYCYTRSMHTLGHMYLGKGQPSALRLALGCIEVASASFRCVSLTLRTVCNAVAGHVLLSVLVDMVLATARNITRTLYS